MKAIGILVLAAGAVLIATRGRSQPPPGGSSDDPGGGISPGNPNEPVWQVGTEFLFVRDVDGMLLNTWRIVSVVDGGTLGFVYGYTSGGGSAVFTRTEAQFIEIATGELVIIGGAHIEVNVPAAAGVALRTVTI